MIALAVAVLVLLVGLLLPGQVLAQALTITPAAIAPGGTVMVVGAGGPGTNTNEYVTDSLGDPQGIGADWFYVGSCTHSPSGYAAPNGFACALRLDPLRPPGSYPFYWRTEFNVLIASGTLMVVASNPVPSPPMLLNPNFSPFRWLPGAIPGTAYTVKCGTTPGTYPMTVRVMQGLELGVGVLISAPGTYFCVVTATNANGEGPPSNEVSFQTFMVIK